MRLGSSLFRNVSLHWFVLIFIVSGQPLGFIFKGGMFNEEDGTESLFRKLVTN